MGRDRRRPVDRRGSRCAQGLSFRQSRGDRGAFSDSCAAGGSTSVRSSLVVGMPHSLDFDAAHRSASAEGHRGSHRALCRQPKSRGLGQAGHGCGVLHFRAPIRRGARFGCGIGQGSAFPDDGGLIYGLRTRGHDSHSWNRVLGRRVLRRRSSILEKLRGPLGLAGPGSRGNCRLRSHAVSE